jgi:hypothetical protein
MLKVALAYAWNPGDFDAAAREAQALRDAQRAVWPPSGIAIAESDLRNRDPLAESRSVRGYLRSLFSMGAPERTPRSNEDLSAFERLPRLPVELDPLTQRPPKRVLAASDLDGAIGLAQFFTAADVDLLERATGGERSRLDAALEGLPAGFFVPAAFGRVKTLNALLAGLRQPARRYEFLDVSAMSPPQALGVPPLALAEGSPLGPFARYCFACHRGNPAKRLDFMAGKDEAEVLANIKARGEIRDALDWARYRGTDRSAKLMPPADSHQRRDLEQALAKEPQLLEEMRKVVPSLFDF